MVAPLEPDEHARDEAADSDLRVDGLRYSLLGRVLSLFGGKR